MIFDTHLHVISSDTGKYPRLDEARELALPAHPIEELLSAMGAAGVDRALLVQAYFTYAFDNRYIADAAAADPARFVAICVLDPLDPTSPDKLSDLVENKGVKGLRLMNDRGRTPVCIDDPATFGLWERAAALDIPLSIAALLPDAPLLRVPLERFPHVRASLDHIWGLDFKSAPIEDLVASILALAAYPNFQIKVAPTNTFAAREAGVEPSELYRLLIDRFGAGRIMWGSNYPVKWGRQGALSERLNSEKAVWSFLPGAQQDMVFGRTAAANWPR